MARWKYNLDGCHMFGIYPIGTKTNKFSGGSTKNGAQCGTWVLRWNVNDYIPNTKRHPQRSILTGKNPEELYEFAKQMTKLLSKTATKQVDKVMAAKKIILRKKVTK